MGHEPDKEALRSRETRRITWMGLAVNLGLCAVKLAGGLLGHSQAVVADAVHSLSDISTDAAILFGLRHWTRPPDSGHPHGHRRVETLVTVGIGLVLGVVATGLVWNSVMTLQQRHETSPGLIALAAALLSIATKEGLYRWTMAVGKRIRSSPVMANAWHHRSDALSSMPAAVAVAGTAMGPSWSFLDHVGAIVVSLFIYQAAFKIAVPALGKLIDRGASEGELEAIRRTAQETAGVVSVHQVRTRYLGSSSLQVDLHVQVDGALSVRDGHEISEAVKEKLLRERDDVVDVVVHLEPIGDGI